MAAEASDPRRLEPTGHAGVYRKQNRYVVVWRHRGRQRKRSFRTLTEARRFKAQTAVGGTAPTSREPFVAFAERWLDGYRGRTSKGLAPSTRASYADGVARVIVPYFRRELPTLKLDELSPSDLRDFIAHMAGEGHAPATVRRYYAPLRAMLATAYEDGRITRNPAAASASSSPASALRAPSASLPTRRAPCSPRCRRNMRTSPTCSPRRVCGSVRRSR